MALVLDDEAVYTTASLTFGFDYSGYPRTYDGALWSLYRAPPPCRCFEAAGPYTLTGFPRYQIRGRKTSAAKTTNRSPRIPNPLITLPATP